MCLAVQGNSKLNRGQAASSACLMNFYFQSRVQTSLEESIRGDTHTIRLIPAGKTPLLGRYSTSVTGHECDLVVKENFGLMMTIQIR